MERSGATFESPVSAGSMVVHACGVYSFVPWIGSSLDSQCWGLSRHLSCVGILDTTTGSIACLFHPTAVG